MILYPSTYSVLYDFFVKHTTEKRVGRVIQYEYSIICTFYWQRCPGDSFRPAVSSPTEARAAPVFLSAVDTIQQYIYMCV